MRGRVPRLASCTRGRSRTILSSFLFIGRSEFSRSAAAASLPVDCARSDDPNGAAEIIPADASERPRGARPMAKASFAAGVRFARGLLPQDELLPSHVVVALGLW